MTVRSRSCWTAARTPEAVGLALALCAAGAAVGARPHPHLDIEDITPATAAAARREVWIESASGLFRALGPDRGQTVALLTLADDTLARLDRMLDAPVPRTAGLPVYLALHPAEDPEAAPVFRRRHLIHDWGIAHRMDVTGLDRAEEGLIRGELVRLLLDRWTAYRQPPDARRERPADAPAGVVYGMARAMLPEVRELAVVQARTAWMEGADVDPARVLGMDRPPGPPDDALATAAILWLQESSPSALSRLLGEAAEGRAVTARGLAGALSLPDERAVARAWALWLAAAEHRRTPWARTVPERVARVRRAVTLDTALWTRPLPADVPEYIGPDLLLARRGEPWVAAVAGHLALRLRHEPTGEPRVLDQAAGRLEQALLDLRWPEPGRPWRWLPHRTSSPQIARTLATVEAALAALEQPTAAAEPNNVVP
jgi:hypothetical protein